MQRPNGQSQRQSSWAINYLRCGIAMWLESALGNLPGNTTSLSISLHLIPNKNRTSGYCLISFSSHSNKFKNSVCQVQNTLQNRNIRLLYPVVVSYCAYFSSHEFFSVKDGFCSFLLTCFDFDIAGSVNPKQKNILSDFNFCSSKDLTTNHPFSYH